MKRWIVLACAIPCGLLGCSDGEKLAPPYVTTVDPYGETVKRVEFVDQNWRADERDRFYFTAQGSQLVPYDWFLHLEQAGSEVPFRDDQNILRYRYYPQHAGASNPDGLPIGFVGGAGSGGRKWLGFTCAACHTNEIHLGDVAYRVDGAPTQADAQAFLVDLVGAMKRTRDDPAKFRRFAAKLAVPEDGLRGELATMIQIREGYNRRNFLGFDTAATAAQAPTRFGRLDAVDSIVNEAFWATVEHPDPNNPTAVALPGDAPVSYPFLWDTAQHDKVEWLGIAANGNMGDHLVGLIGQFNGLPRNVGEVLGVFGDFKIASPPSILSGGYPSSVRMANLVALEDLVRTLWSPTWPAGFPAIDADAARAGAELYRKPSAPGAGNSCIDCHQVIDRKTLDRSRISIAANLTTKAGTDPRAYFNFNDRPRPSGKLAGAFVNLVEGEKIAPTSDASNVLSNVVIGVILGDWKSAPPDRLKQVRFGRPREADLLPQAVANPSIYKGRPLDGIWATAPYLHNGSVPNLDDLLKPAADRSKSFAIGTRTFDPVRVGYRTDAPGFPTFEVVDPDGKPIVGHDNGGHEYGTWFTPAERKQLVEYLKTL